MSDKFNGEEMTCAICFKKETSSPHSESGWTHVQMDGLGFYICPEHLGKPHWSKKQHRRAWEQVLRTLLKRYFPAQKRKDVLH